MSCQICNHFFAVLHFICKHSILITMSPPLTISHILQVILASLETLRVCFTSFIENCALHDKIYDLVPQGPSIGTVLSWSWVTTHFLTIVGFILSVSSANQDLHWYYIASISCVLTYILVTYRQIVLLLSSNRKGKDISQSKHPAGYSSSFDSTKVFRVSTKTSTIPFSTILKSENTHLLGSSILICVSRPSSVKLLSSFVYSYINLATFFMIDVYPDNGLTIALLPLYSYFEEPFLIGSSIIDLAVSLVYFKEYLFNGCPAYLFIIYCMVFAIRFENSKTCQCSAKYLFQVTINTAESFENLQALVTFLRGWDEFLLPNDTISSTLNAPQDEVMIPAGVSTGIATSAYKLDLRKRERIASLMFDSYSIVNDMVVD